MKRRYHKIPKLVKGNEKLLAQWLKVRDLFEQTNKEEDRLGKLLKPLLDSISSPDEIKTIADALGDFSFLARFFYEKEYVLRHPTKAKQHHESKTKNPTR